MPAISIVIPAYNAMAYLPETIESVLRQSFDDFEVIIVNDGSTDGIEVWAAQLTDPRIQLISQPNQGVTVARNRGIAQAQGKWIAFLDADDLWAASKLEKQVQVLTTRPEVGLVYTWVASIDPQGHLRGRISKNEAAGDVWKTLVVHNILECGSTPLVQRQCFETVGVFDPQIGSHVEDKDMWLRIAARYPFAVVKEPLVYYRQHSSSASKNWMAMERGSLTFLERAFASIPPRLSPVEVAALKPYAYGSAYLKLAWKPLQTQTKDYVTSRKLQKQAIAYCPPLRFSKENLRLSLAIALAQTFGSIGYDRILSHLVQIRCHLHQFIQQVFS